jgi:hypothetical protein
MYCQECWDYIEPGEECQKRTFLPKVECGSRLVIGGIHGTYALCITCLESRERHYKHPQYWCKVYNIYKKLYEEGLL